MGETPLQKYSDFPKAGTPSHAGKQSTGQSKNKHASRAKTHDGTIIPDDSNEMWGTDMTKAYTIKDGWGSVFGIVGHFVTDCLGLHAAKLGNRFEALEPVRQGIKDINGPLPGMLP